jgi:AraC-like DNA-binding protein
MTWTAYVPAQSESHIRRTLRDDGLLLAHSWAELEHLVDRRPNSRVLVDPLADGTANVEAILRLVRKFPSTPIVGCVTWSEKGFEAGAELAKYGLRPAILGFNEKLSDLVAKWSAAAVANGILNWAERSLALFPPTLRLATIDLFERPRRYSTGAELALAANISLAAVYRSFKEARLGTPKRMVVIAKMTHAYHYLRNSTLNIAAISSLVGFGRSRTFSDHTKCIFGCLPSRLRTEANTEEIVQELLDWLYRPHAPSEGNA